ncbi:uncharacterized protein [Nicotiana tomentosiformis]|uniref:uncharacterized protein n=1 Tax=Nicotiana tomentosiformis TaxID=4098 RepID=UPI00388C8582
MEHNFCVVALMETFQKKGLIDRYRRKLNMETAYTNINEKIWLLFDAMVEWVLVEDTEKQVTVRVFHHDLGQHMMITFVYAKYSAIERLELLDHLYFLASDMELPWLVGGDFNVNMLPTIEVEHLIRTGSDHAPLLMTCGEQTTNFVKPFRFLNFWTKHATFMDVVRQNFEADFIWDPFLMFKLNIKRVKAPVSKWSRETFGDIFKQLAILEDIVRVKEMLFEEEPTIENKIVLQKAQSELKKYFSIEEQYWKQKAGMIWFVEGDRNTSFFHNHVNGKRKKLQLKRIKSGSWVLSRVLHDRLESFLPSLLSPNQSGFVKGRSIFENILLTQEIVIDIRLRGKPANVVIKLDMSKANDRNFMSNNWYSVLVNGKSSGFFKSTRGVKQGDPLSPALFILSVEVLSRSLNKLFEDKSFVGFGIPKWSDPLNHLAYADDILIFVSAHPPSLRKIMEILGNYEKISVGAITRFARGKFPFTYLGCPIFYTKMRKDHYEDLIKKVKAKLHSWKGKLLSFGGKATLISSVLQSMSVHMLSVLDPPNNILEHLHKIFARFFWRTKKEGRSRYWASWQNLCLPTKEGGLERATNNGAFRGGSHVWRQMLNTREEVEHEIVWKLKSGTTNIWHENWTGLGALYHVLPEDFPINEDLQEVAELRQGKAWDDQLLDQTFNEEIS